MVNKTGKIAQPEGKEGETYMVDRVSKVSAETRSGAVNRHKTHAWEKQTIQNDIRKYGNSIAVLYTHETVSSTNAVWEDNVPRNPMRFIEIVSKADRGFSSCVERPAEHKVMSLA